MRKIEFLTKKWGTELFPLAPFNFNGTVYVPAHFPTPTEEYQKDKWWQTIQFKNKVIGIKFENKGTVDKPKIKLTVFSEKSLTSQDKIELTKELNYRFELDKDIREFTQKFKNDKLLGPAIQRWRGMRSKCGYNLYESLMIYIVLQNATVRRTVQMMNAMLENYGDRVKFDGKNFYVIWKPETIIKVSEEELRKLKVGYRAKFFKRISEDILISGEFNEHKLRKLNNEGLKAKLLKLYGIGPHSVENLLWEVFHRHDVFGVLPPWEQKIYSRLLFNKQSLFLANARNKKLISEDKILETIARRWGKYKRLAAFYIWTDLFWRHKQKPIKWLEKEIRL